MHAFELRTPSESRQEEKSTNNCCDLKCQSNHLKHKHEDISIGNDPQYLAAQLLLRGATAITQPAFKKKIT